ncbi:MAG: glycosyltransferase [Bacteroidales bacterium]|nr:glycosyltransferase [Bacteroidales bacterium]MCF8403319.1 glycosyltransferase [Bacteroidales bacterium]
MRIFVLLPRFPYPLEKGDKLRAYHQIIHLAKNHEVHLCTLSDIKIQPDYVKALEPFCKSIHILSLSKFSILINILKAFLKGLPLQVGYFYNKKASGNIHQLIEEIKPDHIYCQLLRVAEYVKKTSIPKTLDYQDVFSKGMARRAETARFYLKPVFKMEYRRLLKYEKVVFDIFDNKTIISEPDRALIPHPEKDKIKIVINGVDTDFFTPIEIPKAYELVFIGNMGYPPNINAAEYLVKKVLPLVHQKLPEVRLGLAGATPHANVQALANDKVTVTGWVDDIRKYYAKSKIFIAPMQIGTGLQNKLLEAMAMKIPCITSELANQALKAKHGEEILVGNTPEEYAQFIVSLLEDELYSDKLAGKGHTFVHSNFNWTAATNVLESLILNTPRDENG